MPAVAHIMRFCAIVGNGHDLRTVFTAVRAENAHGIIIFAFLFRRVLCAVPVDDIEDLFPVIKTFLYSYS